MVSNLVYVSARRQSCTQKEIDNILASCQKNNKDLDITGVLLYTETRFVQYLEGDYKQIMELYEKIKTDARHSSVVLVSLSSIPKRLFPSWQMGSKKIDEKNVEFNTSLSKDEAAIFNTILAGNEGNTPRAVEVIKKFF